MICEKGAVAFNDNLDGKLQPTGWTTFPHPGNNWKFVYQNEGGLIYLRLPFWMLEIVVFVTGLLVTGVIIRALAGSSCLYTPSCEPRSGPLAWILGSLLAWGAIWGLWVYLKRRR